MLAVLRNATNFPQMPAARIPSGHIPCPALVLPAPAEGLRMYCDTRTAAAHIGLSKSLLEKARMTGTGPTYFKIGHAVRYRIEDLDKWMEAGRRSKTWEDRPKVM